MSMRMKAESSSFTGEAVILARGRDDYSGLLADTISAGQAHKSLAEISLKDIKFNLTDSGCSSPISIEVYLGEFDGEDHYRREIASPIFDRQTVTYILTNKEKLRVYYPDLVSMVERYWGDPQVVEVLNLLYGSGDYQLGNIGKNECEAVFSYQASDVILAGESRLNEIRDIIELTYGQAIISAAKILDRKIMLEDLDTFWPPQLLELARGQLSLFERASFISSAGELVREVLLKSHDDLGQLPKLLNVGNSAEGSFEIGKFIVDNFQYISVEDLLSIGRVGNSAELRLTEAEKLSVLCSLASRTHRKKILALGGVDSAVVVLQTYRGYKSCNSTESRLLEAVENEDIGCFLQRLNFPDGTYSVLVYKYQEVTLAVCVSSNNINFTRGQSYRPVGETFENACASFDSGVRAETVDVQGLSPLSMIWAYNRPLGFTEEEWKIINDYVRSYYDDVAN